MEIINELIKPDFTRKPFYKTNGLPDNYVFECIDCKHKISIDSELQIYNHWILKSDKISERDLNFLFGFYKIGINKKSSSGGFPVFDKLTCVSCSSIYVSYCGVKEVSNSNFEITLDGLILTGSSKLSKTLRKNVIDILDLLSDYEAQKDYAYKVSDYIAIQEMICMWFDDNYNPDSSNFIKGFSDNELAMLKDFNDYYDSISDSLPKDNIRTLQINENWEKLIGKARILKDKIKNAT